GIAAATLLWTYERFLESVVTRTTVDILHFSLHPLDASRLGLAFGLLLLHAAVIWGAAAIARLPRLAWRLTTGTLPIIAGLAWSAGALAGVAMVRTWSPPIPSTPLVVTLAAAGAGA